MIELPIQIYTYYGGYNVKIVNYRLLKLPGLRFSDLDAPL